MPIYEYKCGSCQQECEFIQKFNEPPMTQCPNCQQAALTRQISAPLFQLKGTGWYVTDFKDNNKNNKNVAASEASSSSTAPTTSPKDSTATTDSASHKEKTENKNKEKAENKNTADAT